MIAASNQNKPAQVSEIQFTKIIQVSGMLIIDLFGTYLILENETEFGVL